MRPLSIKPIVQWIFCTLLILSFNGCAPPPHPAPIFRPTPVYIPPPPPQVTPVTKVNNKDTILIAIDAGHGGEDFGAQSTTTPRYQEKYLNLSAAKMLKHFLEEQGYKVMMTRMGDEFIALDKRADFANNQEATLFVSVHFNSAPAKEADGIEVYYYRSNQNKNRTENSMVLASSILNKVVESTQAKSRGTKHGNFAVIRQTTMPAVLVEGGFLTNDNEMQKIKDPAYLKKLAWGITRGIEDYLDKQL